MFFGFVPLFIFTWVLVRIIRNVSLRAQDEPRRITQVTPTDVRDVEYTEVRNSDIARNGYGNTASQSGTAYQQPSYQQPRTETFVRSTRIQSIATDAAAQEQRIPVQSQRINETIRSTFEASSLTGQKYLTVVSAAYQKIQENHRILLRQMQAFDEKGYVQLDRLIHSGQAAKDNIDDSIQMEQLTLYETQLDQMTKVLNDNERIFLFLEKLGMELQTMSSTKDNQAMTDLLNEIQNLIGDVKYYS